MMMSLPIYTAVSSLATVCTVSFALGRAGSIPEQGAALHILKVVFADKLSVLLLVNLTYTILLWVAKSIQYIFFGLLRPVESQHMYDRLLNYLMLKIMFVGAILEPDMYELIMWTTWFSILGFLRVFSMLARDRFDFVTASPTTPTNVHGRLLFLLVTIQVLNVSWLGLCMYVFSEAGVSVLFLLVFECATLFIDTLQTIMKYCIHLYDLQYTGVWEQRNSLMYHTEIITDLAVQLATLLHYVHVLALHGINFTLIDAVLFLNIRTEFKQFRKRLAGYRNYFIANRSLNTLYPDVTPEQLKVYDDHCAICRDNMLNAKQLPCKHMFHASCLRSWLEHHGSCPTCRMSLVEDGPPSASDPATASVLASRNRASLTINNSDMNVLRPLTGLQPTRALSLPHPAVDRTGTRSNDDGPGAGSDITLNNRGDSTAWATSQGSDRRLGGSDLRRRRREGDRDPEVHSGETIASLSNVHRRPHRRASAAMSDEGSSHSSLPRLQQVSDAFVGLPPLAFNQSSTTRTHTPSPRTLAGARDGSVLAQARAQTASPPSTSAHTHTHTYTHTHTHTHTQGVAQPMARGARAGMDMNTHAGGGLGRLSGWLEQLIGSFTATPRLSEEELQGMVEGVLEVFPQTSRHAVLADLRRTGSVVQTIDNVLTWPTPAPTPTPVLTSVQTITTVQRPTTGEVEDGWVRMSLQDVPTVSEHPSVGRDAGASTEQAGGLEAESTTTRSRTDADADADADASNSVSYPVGTYHSQRIVGGTSGSSRVLSSHTQRDERVRGLQASELTGGVNTNPNANADTRMGHDSQARLRERGETCSSNTLDIERDGGAERSPGTQSNSTSVFTSRAPVAEALDSSRRAVGRDPSSSSSYYRERTPTNHNSSQISSSSHSGTQLSSNSHSITQPSSSSHSSTAASSNGDDSRSVQNNSQHVPYTSLADPHSDIAQAHSVGLAARRDSFTDSELSRHINVFRSSQTHMQHQRRHGGVTLTMGAGVDRAISGLGSFLAGNYPSEPEVSTISNSVVDEEKQRLIAQSRRRYTERLQAQRVAVAERRNEADGSMGLISDAALSQPASVGTETSITDGGASPLSSVSGDRASATSSGERDEVGMDSSVADDSVGTNTSATEDGAGNHASMGVMSSVGESDGPQPLVLSDTAPSSRSTAASGTPSPTPSPWQLQVQSSPVQAATGQPAEGDVPTSAHKDTPFPEASLSYSRDEIREQAFLAAEARRTQNRL